MESLITMKRVHNDSGFTLLELIIIVAIVGLIGAIAAPNILNWTTARSIQSDLTAIEARIEYARAVSVSENRQVKIILINNLMRVRILDSNTPTNRNSSCTNTNLNNPNEYAEDYSFTATVTSRHNNSGQTSGRNFVAAPTNNAAYSQNSGVLCFNSDGTTSSGGFLIQQVNPRLSTNDPMRNEQYRIDVFQTGFYSAERYVVNELCTAPNCWQERD